MIEHLERQFTREHFASVRTEKPFEVEEQAVLNDGQDLEIQQELLRRGGSHVANELIEDTFYCPADITDFGELETRALNKQIIRIRKSVRQTEDGRTVTTTVFTTKTKHTPESAWDEHNFVRDGDHVSESDRELTQKEHLKPYYRITKKRSDWKLGEMTVTFDRIPDFGTFLEVEKQTDKQGIASAKKDVRSFMRSLGITADQKPAKSIMSRLDTSRLRL